MQKIKAINFVRGKYSQIKCFMAKIVFNSPKNIASYITLDLKGKNKSKIYDIKFREINAKNKKYNIIETYLSNNNFIAIISIIVKYIIIINLFYETKNMLHYCFFHNSKIALKVRGIGESTIISNFENNIDKIYINANEQNKKLSKYFFNQSIIS